MPKRFGCNPRKKATGRSRRRLIALTLLAAGSVASCTGPAPRTVPTLAPVADQQPPIRLSAPRLSPDGTAILFAFKYGKLPYKLAVISTNPAQSRVVALEAPPTMSWTEPAWAPDGRHFAAVSYCQGDNCYENAKGYHVWRFAIRPGPDNLQRITLDEGSARRDEPFFGRTADDLFWVLSSSLIYEGMRMDLHDRFIARASGEQGQILFPDDASILTVVRPDAVRTIRPGAWIRSTRFELSALSPARAFDGTTLYFVGIVGRGTHPAARAAMDSRRFSFEPMLFRWRGGDAVELVRTTPVQAVDAQRFGGGFVTVSRPGSAGARPSEFHVVRGGTEELRLRFDQGFAYSVSTSEKLDAIAFLGERSYWGERAIWLHREGMAQAVDLNVAERVRREVEFQIQREANEAAAGQEPRRATPAPSPPAAAPR